MQHQPTLNRYLKATIQDNWDRQALTNFHGQSMTYGDVARKIAKLHLLFKHCGIESGDRVAICGRNSAQWAVCFVACLAYGAVAVPILHEFKPDNIHHLVKHSEAKLLFVDKTIWENLDHNLIPNIQGAMSLADLSLIFSRSVLLTEARANFNRYFGEAYPDRFTCKDVPVADLPDDRIAMINYTSGSTGFSKGVMLPARSLWSNLDFVIEYLPYLEPGDGMVCMLPMAHMYGLTIELLHPFVKGAHLHFLTRTPSPRVILEAFGEIKPKVIVSVPLILEKIIKTKVFPLLEKPYMRLLLHVPFLDDRLLNKVKQRLTSAFGGNLKEIIIGGAALNKEVEVFLRRIGFPFTVGYGMTECGPLISYAPWYQMRPGSCGRVVSRMQAKVASPDPATIPGVLWVKGDNVMKGYYKNDEATQAAFDADGWMCTGDIVNLDADNFIYIHGRDKNMILGPSGQNIYPEEIEQVFNNLPYVNESIVIEEGGKLVALIYPDLDNASAQGIDTPELEKIMNENLVQANKELPGYSQVSRIKLTAEEFEKTPKRSIKRYLYQTSK